MEDVTIVTISPQTVLGIRKKGHYRQIAELLPQIAIYAMENSIPIAGPPIFVCHEFSKEEAMKADQKGRAEIEVAFPVAPDSRPGPGMNVYLLPGGRMARIVHRGPYEACEPTYLKLFAWIEERGMKITGPIREIYHNDPREVLPEEIMTEFLVPVE
ncbi:MAG: transcriptional regulator [Methanomicrobiales archaeon]|nr:transcriptional regulator [Methanomicrobiales archaeon]NYT20317.1 transcriptional regulator [Methanomicrobiales archaeon]